MAAVVSLFIVLILSLLITRLATAALTLTGMSKELAQLQSVSAFTGVGFTTSESEAMVGLPQRRRVLLVLMVLGNAGVVTAISSLILSFTNLEGTSGYLRAAAIFAGLVVFALLVRSRPIERGMHRVMRWLLARVSAARPIDYARLLDLGGDYVVDTYAVDEGDWTAGCDLAELALFEEGIVVLGVHRAGGHYVGVPRGETQIEPGDILVLYGREDDIRQLRKRRRDIAGEAEHERAVQEHRRRREDQQREDLERRRREPPRQEELDWDARA
jgi:hypothetical protein